MSIFPQLAAALSVALLLTLPAEAVSWGRSIHQGVESIGMRNGDGELFSFVCNYADNPGLLGVEFEIKRKGPLKTTTGPVMVRSFLKSGKHAGSMVFPAKADDEGDLAGVSTYSFKPGQARKLIALASQASRLIVKVPMLGTVSQFEPMGGERSWKEIDCKF